MKGICTNPLSQHTIDIEVVLQKKFHKISIRLHQKSLKALLVVSIQVNCQIQSIFLLKLKLTRRNLLLIMINNFHNQ